MDDLDKMLQISVENEKNRIMKFIQESVKDLNRSGVIFGLSGGLDSCLLAYFVKELYSQNSLALILPEKDSNKENMKDAKELAEKLDLNYEVIDITPILDQFGTYKLLPASLKRPVLVKTMIKGVRAFKHRKILHSLTPEEVSRERKEVRAAFAFGMPKLRTRMILLHKYAGLNDYAVLGTTNKTEYLLGHYDIYGDGAVDIECLLHLYKSQEKELAKYMGVPQKILSKPPSPDLLPGLNDEDLIGMSFEDIDRVLTFIESKKPLSEAKAYGISDKDIDEAKKAIQNSDLKRKLPLSLI